MEEKTFITVRKVFDTIKKKKSSLGITSVLILAYLYLHARKRKKYTSTGKKNM